MKKLIFAMLICIVAGQVLASGTPLRGEKTIDPAGSGPDNYTSFAAAINDLNDNGVGTDGVIFNVPAGLTFTLDAALPAITVQGTEANPVTFQKMGTGANPLVTFAGTGGSSDYIFKLEGAKYVTFDGIDIANAGASTALEYGYFVVDSGMTGGSLNNTIKNCNITLSRSNSNSIGVKLQHSGSPNSNNLLQNIHVTESYNGIFVLGTESLAGVNNVVEACVFNGIANTGIKFDYQENANVFDNQVNFPNGGILGGSMYGFDSYELTNSAVYNNTFSGGNINKMLYVIFFNLPAQVEVHHNNINNITTSAVWFQAIYASQPRWGLTNIHHNNIHDINAAMICWTIYTMRGYDIIINDNHIYNINAGWSFWGIHAIENLSLESPANIFNNRIHGIRITENGIQMSSAINVQDRFANIYNNMVYDISAPLTTLGGPEPQICGISLKDMQAAQAERANVYNNTVMLDATGPANSRSAAFYSSFIGPVDLKNNIFINNSVHGENGKAVAFWKYGTDFDNYIATMDKNIYYAGTPSPNNLIHFNYDGETTNSAQTLAEYKALNVGKDQNSYTENVPFVSSVEPYDLHINPNIPTNVESNGIYLPSVLIDDIDGDLRSETPDIGADEGDFTPMGGGGTVLDIPTNLSILNLDDNLMISWDAVDGAAGYYVYASDAPYADAPWGTPIFTVDAPLTSISIPADTQYKFFYITAFE